MALPPSSLFRVGLSWCGRALGELVAPRGCASCDAPLRRSAVFCAPCAAAVERAPKDLELWAFGLYGGPLAEALKRFKYGARPDLQEQLGALLAEALGPPAPDLRGWLLAPVPLHPTRLRERGYNQAALLASSLARRRGGDYAPSLLRRARATPQQALLPRGLRGEGTPRVENVRAAFALGSAQRVQGRRILLVDDVRTSGATLEACALPLWEGGAAEVRSCVVAFARSDGGGA